MMKMQIERAAQPVQKRRSIQLSAVFALVASVALSFVLACSLAVMPSAAFAAGSSSSAKQSATRSSSQNAASSNAQAAASSSSATQDAAQTATADTTQSDTFIFDERGLFTQDQLNTLESTAKDLAQNYNMGVYFLTTSKMNGLSDPTSSQRTSYATDFYKQHGLGLNKGENGYGDGIMFVIAADSRDYVTIAYGQGSYSFSDKGIESMEEAVLDNIRDHKDDWYGAATAYYQSIGSQLLYYSTHGKAQEPIGTFGWILRIALVLGLPLFITSVIIGGWRKEMLTAVEQSEAGNYLDRNSVVLTRSDDQFIRTSLIATPKPKDDHDSGGGWGGGGGGGFSSSGGGKF